MKKMNMIIKIEKPYIEEDGLGGYGLVWQLVANVFGRYVQMIINDSFKKESDNRLILERRYIFETRYIADVDESMRLVIGGDIMQIDKVYQEKKRLVIHAIATP